MKRTLLYAAIPIFVTITGAIALAGSYSNTRISLEDSLTQTLFTGEPSLSITTLTYASNINLSSYSLHSSCNIDSKFLSQSLNTYTFLLNYDDFNCNSNSIYLKDNLGNVILESQVNLEIYSDFALYNRFTDYASNDLEKVLTHLNKKIDASEIFAHYDKDSVGNKYDFYSKKLAYHQYMYNASIVENILAYREYKYIVPVLDGVISTQESKLPNALRPYRQSYTDGIHHGWDVDGNLGDTAIALDNGVILRVVDDFTPERFNELKKTGKLSEDDEITNLDILRGNQVWLKTMKGDVVFYSHLQDVSVQVGDIVIAGDPLGTIRSTGVSDSTYRDYHLHFPIHKNPYNRKLAGKYSQDDIMRWPWYFKGETFNYIREHQWDVFK